MGLVTELARMTVLVLLGSTAVRLNVLSDELTK